VGELTSTSLVGESASAAGNDQLLGVEADAEDANSGRHTPNVAATPTIIVGFSPIF
jgi:hypothetical protein